MVSASSGLLKSVELFDLYEGDQLPPGKRNLAFALDIVSSHRTLTDAEIEDEVRRAVTAVVRELGAQLRA
jgi:phenylalanyl-tRNA synthetase beta chain